MAKRNVPSRPKWAKNLSDSEEAFVREYLVDLNGTAAIVRLGRTENRNSAAQIAHVLLHKAHIAEAVDLALAENASGPRQWLVGSLAKIAQADISEFFVLGEDGVLALKPGSEITPEAWKLVKKIYTTKDGEVRVELHDKLRAMELLGKVRSIGLTEERVAVEDPGAALTPDVDLARKLAFFLEGMIRRKKAGGE